MKNIHRVPGEARPTRRSFVTLAAVGVIRWPGRREKDSAAQPLPARTSPLDDLPPLDGQLLFDDAARQAAASDNGGHVRRSPVAVLRHGRWPTSCTCRLREQARSQDRDARPGPLAVRPVAGRGRDRHRLERAERRAMAWQRRRRCPAGRALGRRGEGDARREPDAAGHARRHDADRGRHAQRRRHRGDQLSLRRAGRQRPRARRGHRSRAS